MALPRSGYLTTWHAQRDSHGWGGRWGRLTSDFFEIKSIPTPSYVLYGWLNVRGGKRIAEEIFAYVIGYVNITQSYQHYRGTYYILIEQKSVKGYLIHGEMNVCPTYVKW